MAQHKESYTLAEIAQRWGCSHSTVLMHVYDGTLRAVDISTNPRKRSRYIVPSENLAAFEEARTAPPPERPMGKRRRVRVPAEGVVEFFSEG